MSMMRKFMTLKAEESKLEQYLWNAQIEEANNLEGETPLLNSIAKAKGIEVSAVATSVLAGNKTFNEKVQALYDAMLSLKQEFKNCATIRELNVLWQKYMGVPMPYSQMVEEGIAEEGGIPPVIPVLVYNSRLIFLCNISSDAIEAFVEGNMDYGMTHEQIKNFVVNSHVTDKRKLRQVLISRKKKSR